MSAKNVSQSGRKKQTAQKHERTARGFARVKRLLCDCKMNSGSATLYVCEERTKNVSARAPNSLEAHKKTGAPGFRSPPRPNCRIRPWLKQRSDVKDNEKGESKGRLNQNARRTERRWWAAPPRAGTQAALLCVAQREAARRLESYLLNWLCYFLSIRIVINRKWEIFVAIQRLDD